MMGRIKIYLASAIPIPKSKGLRLSLSGIAPRLQNQFLARRGIQHKLRINPCSCSLRCFCKSLVIINIFAIIWAVFFYTALPEYKIYNQDIFMLTSGRIKLKRCNFPKLDPFSEEIRGFIEKPSFINCPRLANNLLEEVAFRTDRNSNLIRESSYKNECCYRPFERESDARVELAHVCYSITDDITEIPPEHEFIEVLCVHKNPEYRDGFALVPRKPSTEYWVEGIEKAYTKAKDNRVSVIMFGIDATSHMNFKRMLPDSLKYLTLNLNSISMNGYTKVAENTLPNVVPLLTGMKLTKFKEACVEPYFPSSNINLDGCPFIWKKFSSNGYRTSFAEDDTGISIFNMNWPNAFAKAPTDYYLRPFSYRMQNNGNQASHDNGDYCYGSRLSFKVLLDNVENTAATFQDELFFQFTWSTKLTHSDFNKLALGDKHLLSTLKFLNENGHLNNTVFILISDHGARLDDIRNTHQGQIEDRMPFAYFVLPPWLKKKYPKAVENMKENGNRVTSAFDVYETLKDLMDLQRLNNLGSDSQNVFKKEIGTSLFMKLPESRTCSAAGIPSHWCLCHGKSSIDTGSTIVYEAVVFIVGSLNSLLSKNSKCAQLSLDEITEALQWNEDELEYEDFGNSNGSYISAEDSKLSKAGKELKKAIILQISFVTVPGDASFEATVLRHPEHNWILMEQVVRTNSYEGQDYCVEQDMKEYCYCTTPKSFI